MNSQYIKMYFPYQSLKNGKRNINLILQNLAIDQFNMGNKQLQQLHFNPTDPDLIQFRRLYQRYTPQRLCQIHNQCTQEFLEYQIIIHNEAFCEVFERNHHINLKKTNIQVDIALARFSGNLRLLNYKTNLNGKVQNSRFMRLKDFIEYATDPQKMRILDVDDPSFKFTRKLHPEDKLLIEYHYIMKLPLMQNNLRILSLPLNPDCPYKINITATQTHYAFSPTHKINQNNNTIQCNFTKGTDSSLFVLLFSMKSELICTKILFGAEGYSPNHKYCLYLQLPLPPILYDEMFYLNCDDPKKRDAEQDTMETIPWSSIQTIQTISQLQWPYFYEVQQFTSKRHITFFLDQSNSMEGTKMELAKGGLRLFIRSLTPECYFNVYGFGSKWKKMFQVPQKISEPVLQQFEYEVQLLEGNMGSTFLLSALKDALQQSPKTSDTIWFILTDGRIAEIEEIFELILQNPHIRIFSLGFGLEFDHSTVEQLANISNGGYSFCSNLQALNTSMIQLLQQALQPQFKMKGKFDNLQITSMYPSFAKPNRELMCFLNSQQLQDNPNIEFEMTFGIENEPEITQKYSCSLKEVKNNHYLHLYGYIQMLDQILSQISYSDTITSVLSKNTINDFDINNPLLLLFFNPLNILIIDNHAMLCNINLEALQKLQNEQKKQRDLVELVLQYLSDQTYEQALRQVKANENIQEQSVSLEMGSSFTQANQEYLMKVIQSQQIDGSFIATEAIKLVCPTRNPLDSLLQRFPDQNTSQEIINGRQTQQLPNFIMTQIWSTALVIAYLKMNYKQQRGQWVIIFQKALNFIKLYVKNWQPLLYKARQELISIEF